MVLEFVNPLLLTNYNGKVMSSPVFQLLLLLIYRLQFKVAVLYCTQNQLMISWPTYEGKHSKDMLEKRRKIHTNCVWSWCLMARTFHCFFIFIYLYIFLFGGWDVVALVKWSEISMNGLRFCFDYLCMWRELHYRIKYQNLFIGLEIFVFLDWEIWVCS